MRDFRPIACCNVLIKCYSLVLTSRLKRVIPELTEDYQSAFVKRRQILDNVLLTHDLVRGYNRKGGHPKAVLKLGIITYDTLKRDFLFFSMQQLGFGISCFSLCSSWVFQQSSFDGLGTVLVQLTSLST